MACNCGRTRGVARSGITNPRSPGGQDVSQAVAAGSAVMHEVLTASGASTGRKFQSLISATTYAARIGGSIRRAER